MVAIFKSALNTIYTLFTYFYTLFSFSKGPRLSVTPFPVDLESGPEQQETKTKQTHPNVSFAPPLRPPGSVSDHQCFSPCQLHYCTVSSQICHSGPPPTAPPQMPLPPLQQFVFPTYPSLRSNPSVHSIVASPVSDYAERPGSARSASSNISDCARSQSSACSPSKSHVCKTPPNKKKTHKKQSPIAWFKDVSDVTGSSSSLSSMQSAGSSVSTVSLQRHHSARRSYFQGVKPDPSISYKRFAVRQSRTSRQSKAPGSARPTSEDPVSIVRKAFLECGSQVDTEKGGARARLMNRETARSFGGMEIVSEEDEEEQEQFCCPPDLEKLQEVSGASSQCSTPGSSGPLTPVMCCVPVFSPCPSEVQLPPESLLSSSKFTQLPYLSDRKSVALSSLGLPLSSIDSLSEKAQSGRMTARFSNSYADQRISVVTWSDLVSFSTYGLNTMDDAIEQKEEVEKDTQARAQHAELSLKHERKVEYLADDSTVEDSGADLAAMLDSMSILVGQGLDARLLLSPPRQFDCVHAGCS